MKCIESIRHQKVKLNGKVRRGIHIQVADLQGKVLGETGWVNYSNDSRSKIARLKLDHKFAILTHPDLRDNADIDTGTDLLRLVVGNLQMPQHAYDILIIHEIVPSTLPFYLAAFDALVADKTLSKRPTVSYSEGAFGFSIPIRQE